MFNHIFFILLAIIPLFILWAFIHEMSHFLMMKRFVTVSWWKMKLYPHISEYGFRWAAIECRIEQELSEKQKVMVALAPRIPDIIALCLFPLAYIMPGWWSIVWLSLCGAGIVDFAVGSIGYSKHSDLRKASTLLDISPWWLRIFGFSLISIIVFSLCKNILQ